MFQSLHTFKKAGFDVKNGNHHLLVASHSSLPEYLFKKFSDVRTQSFQISNYLQRIKGAEAIRHCINKHGFQRLVVPHKWLYRLPRNISSNSKASYILIVENMELCTKKENLENYYYIDVDTLTELCIVLHEVGGCDAYPRNQWFTRSGQIAFVDTEHVGQKKGHFLKHLVPHLNPEMQVYAKALWMKLEARQ